MSNFQLDITSWGKEKFIIAFSLCGDSKVIAYRLIDGLLYLYWATDKDATALPYEMTVEQAAEFAWGWLLKANYGEEPDHDGSNKKGWRVFNRSDYGWRVLLIVEPTWAMYGK